MIFGVYVSLVKILDGISASYLIKYVHNGWSCDLGIFGMPEINFCMYP